jgi:hypothetical protein
VQKNIRSIALMRFAWRRSIRAGLDPNLDIQHPSLWAESLSSGKLASEKFITRSYNLEIKHLLTLTEGYDNSEMRLRELTVTALVV